MTVTSTTASSTADPYAAINGSTSVSSANAQTEVGDRFLKLLVAQMKNQDPLNPLDNAQVTTQMAQINTVTGLDKLNTAITSLSAQFTQMQALQSASLVGRDVTVPGNQLAVNAAGTAMTAGFELATPADKVKVELLDSAGQVVDTLQLGAQGTGRHSFDWTPKEGTSAGRFRVSASSGSTELTTTALMIDRVSAVSTSGSSLQLELQRSGSVAYGDIKSFN